MVHPTKPPQSIDADSCLRENRATSVCQILFRLLAPEIHCWPQLLGRLVELESDGISTVAVFFVSGVARALDELQRVLNTVLDGFPVQEIALCCFVYGWAFTGLIGVHSFRTGHC